MSLIDSLWAKLPTWESFGGRITRKNYADQPVVNRDTDVDAQEYNSLALAAVQMARTSPFCVLQVSLGSGTNNLDYIQAHVGDVEVTIEVVSTGVYNLRFPTTLTDQANRTTPTNLGLAIASLSFESGVLYPVVRVKESNVVEVSILNLSAAGAPSNNFAVVGIALWSAFL